MNVLFLGTEEDRTYVPRLKPLMGGLGCHVILKPLDLLTHLEMVCNKLGVTSVISTNTDILKALLLAQGNIRSNPSLNDYAGSLFSFGVSKQFEIVFINPLKQLLTVPYGEFIAERFISKVTRPTAWREPTEFKWSILKTQEEFQDFYSRAAAAFLLSCDIETKKKDLAISHTGYTAIFICPDTGAITTETAVIQIKQFHHLEWIRKLNSLEVPKIFQNGKYDNAYNLRFRAEPNSWFWDTAHLMHSQYSELPKDLAFLNAFFLRRVVYWKDLAETSDEFEYCRYNALDTWATANVLISQILQLPDYAKRNYLLEFPLVYPCLLSEMTGLIRDTARLAESRKVQLEKDKKELASLQRMCGAPINPGSHVQVKKLMQVLGVKEPKSSDEKSLKALAYAHPIADRIIGKILQIREARKLRTTYLRTAEDADKNGEGGSKDFIGRDGTSRLLYSLNPHGTDTGRLASRSSAFWCGDNIQNIPTGPEVKSTIRAAEGFFIAECDLEQAESRDTAYISGDAALIAAVESPRDFHSVNASAFFGIPYEDLYDDSRKKTKNKPVRDISKRTNHGANYNMGAGVLADTMGLPAVWEAKKILKLPFTDPLEVTEYLLGKFHLTYKTLRGMIHIRSQAVVDKLGIKNNDYKLYAPGTYYAAIAAEVRISGKVVSRAFHHTKENLRKSGGDDSGIREYIEKGDWTRKCFGRPWEHKLDLNALAAHPSQSLNARTLNEAYMRVFYEIALPNPTTFRLHAQIHDSILFSYAASSDHPRRVRECMEIPVTVRNVHGAYATFTVPAALKLGKKNEQGELVPAIYWSETE